MASTAQLFVWGLLATTGARGQAFSGSARDPDAFTYVQPKNTTILGPYGHSPPVYPSRMAVLFQLISWVSANVTSKCNR